MVLSRYPFGFQSMAWGCITPALSVAQARTSQYPAAGSSTLARKFCQAPSLAGASSAAAVQVAPKSYETSTAATVRSPDQAWPAHLDGTSGPRAVGGIRDQRLERPGPARNILRGHRTERKWRNRQTRWF